MFFRFALSALYETTTISARKRRDVPKDDSAEDSSWIPSGLRSALTGQRLARVLRSFASTAESFDRYYYTEIIQDQYLFMADTVFERWL
jgi:hypothetical protein